MQNLTLAFQQPDRGKAYRVHFITEHSVGLPTAGAGAAPVHGKGHPFHSFDFEAVQSADLLIEYSRSNLENMRRIFRGPFFDNVVYVPPKPFDYSGHRHNRSVPLLAPTLHPGGLSDRQRDMVRRVAHATGKEFRNYLVTARDLYVRRVQGSTSACP